MRLWALIGLGLAIVLAGHVDFPRCWETLRSIPLLSVAFATSACCLNVLLKAFRWHRMARQLSIQIPLQVSLAAFCSGAFWGLFTIGRVGELMRMEALLDRTPSKLTALATCTTDRAIDLAFLIFAAGIAAILSLAPWSVGVRTALAFSATLAVGSATLGLSHMVRTRLLPQLARKEPELLPGGGRLQALLRGAGPLLIASSDLLLRWQVIETLALTALSWGAYLVTVDALMAGVGMAVPFSALSVTAPLSAVVAALPISFQGIGTRDAVFVFMLASYGVTTTQAVSLSLAILGVAYLATLPLGTLGLFWRHRQKARTGAAPTPAL
ncbi:MAG TPA: lysylphosphatidylglycerol synthase transmembrane domain-containing protein [Polyangiaceae bacterium]|nr:lysylphosphatidylglycerol synthase transmembrane domain-containing protein [Polyangiaceae bacterium]